MATAEPMAAPGPSGKSTSAGIASWLTLVVLTTVYTFGFFSRMILPVLVPDIKTDIPMSDTAMSLVLGFAFQTMVTVVSLLSAPLADRHNRRPFILVGLTIWSCATALSAFAASFGQLFAARLLVGIGEGLFPAVAVSIIGDLFPARLRGRATSIYALGASLGGGLASYAGGTLLPYLRHNDALLGHGLHAWQTMLIFSGTCGCLIIAMVAFCFVPQHGKRPGQDILGAVDDRIGPFLRANWVTFAALFVPMAGSAILVFGSGSWLPTFFHRFHVTEEAHLMRLWGGINFLCAGCGTLLGGVMLDRRARVSSRAMPEAFLIATLLSSAGYGLAGIVDDRSALVFCLAAGSLGAGAMQAFGVAAAIAFIPPAMRARFAALYMAGVTWIGAVCGPLAVALLSDRLLHGAIGEAIGILSLVVGIGAVAVTAATWRRYALLSEPNAPV